MKRPSWSDLTEEQQKIFGNGIGPGWVPVWFRKLITERMSWYFEEASWKHHDFGYCVGYTEEDRRECDLRFLEAMLTDASSQRGEYKELRVFIAVFISLFFFLMVRAVGWWNSFEYGDRYRSIDEILNDFV